MKFRLVYAQSATGFQLFHRSDLDRSEAQMVELAKELFEDQFHRHSFPGVPSLTVFTHKKKGHKTMLVFVARES